MPRWDRHLKDNGNYIKVWRVPSAIHVTCTHIEVRKHFSALECMLPYLLKILCTFLTPTSGPDKKPLLFRIFRLKFDILLSSLPHTSRVLPGQPPCFDSSNLDVRSVIKLVIPHFSPAFCYCVGRDSSVGIATRYGLDGRGIESRWGREFPYPSRSAMRPNQPPKQWVSGLSRG
jgi:hypothetical protein